MSNCPLTKNLGERRTILDGSKPAQELNVEVQEHIQRTLRNNRLSPPSVEEE
jgi:hypothetical protein